MDILEFKPDRLGHCTNIHPNLKGSHKLFGKLIESKIPVGKIFVFLNIKIKLISGI